MEKVSRNARKGLLVMFILVFSIGFVSSMLLSNLLVYDAEKPLNIGLKTSTIRPDKQSPSDHIKQDQIHVLKDKIVIDLKDAAWSTFTDSNSMDPFLDKEANGIEIRPTSPSQVGVGDIVAYKSSLTTGVVIHRVVEKGFDENGTYFILKGDNNPGIDPEKVRFEQIEGVLVGIIY